MTRGFGINESGITCKSVKLEENVPVNCETCCCWNFNRFSQSFAVTAVRVEWPNEVMGRKFGECTVKLRDVYVGSFVSKRTPIPDSSESNFQH